MELLFSPHLCLAREQPKCQIPWEANSRVLGKADVQMGGSTTPGEKNLSGNYGGWFRSSMVLLLSPWANTWREEELRSWSEMGVGGPGGATEVSGAARVWVTMPSSCSLALGRLMQASESVSTLDSLHEGPPLKITLLSSWRELVKMTEPAPSPLQHWWPSYRHLMDSYDVNPLKFTEWR